MIGTRVSVNLLVECCVGTVVCGSHVCRPQCVLGSGVCGEFLCCCDNLLNFINLTSVHKSSRTHPTLVTN